MIRGWSTTPYKWLEWVNHPKGVDDMITPTRFKGGGRPPQKCGENGSTSHLKLWGWWSTTRRVSFGWGANHPTSLDQGGWPPQRCVETTPEPSVGGVTIVEPSEGGATTHKLLRTTPGPSRTTYEPSRVVVPPGPLITPFGESRWGSSSLRAQKVVWLTLMA